MTCRDRQDGAGAQITAAISTILYAQFFGYRYVHSPLCDVAHFEPDDDPAEWAARWERFFSLGDGETPASNFADLESVYLRRPHRWRPRIGKLNFVHHCHKVTNRHPELWNRYRPELRRKFALDPKPPALGGHSDKRVIAVHVRRGDVTADNQFTSRFTPNERITGILAKVIEALEGENHEVHLYSQSGSDFSGFDRFDPVWHLDEDPFATFHALASCDILLSAISSYSWLAALINPAKVIQDKFWHPTMPDWMTFCEIDSQPASNLADYLRTSNPVPQ